MTDKSVNKEYDALATELLSNTEIKGPGGYTHPQISAIICEYMNWEEFDLVEDHYEFDKIYEIGGKDEIMAHSFIAYLRNHMYTTARHRNIGPMDVNIYGSVYHEYWFKKLVDKLNAIQQNKRNVRHNWIN